MKGKGAVGIGELERWMLLPIKKSIEQLALQVASMVYFRIMFVELKGLKHINFVHLISQRCIAQISEVNL